MHVHNATREFDFGSLGIFLTPISTDTVASLGMVLGIMKRPSNDSDPTTVLLPQHFYDGVSNDDTL